jgi:peptidoglycan/LPS O-acetylase OafA/YrhL
VAVLDTPDAPAPTTWRPSAGWRYGCLALTVAAVALAIAVVVTGPPRSVAFDIRLPLVVLALGMLWSASQWRRRVVKPPRRPVPMATPWLILPAAVGIAALTIKGLTAQPELAGAALAVASALCCLSLGICVLRERSDEAMTSAVVAEDGLGKGARVVLEQAPASAARAQH